MAAALDHLVIGGSDLGLIVGWWKQQSGTDAARGGSHPGFGTRNALIGVDDSTYVELLAPDPGQPAPAQPRLFGIDELEENSAQLSTLVLAVPDIDDAAGLVREAGLNPGPIFEAERTRSDGVTMRWRLAIPPDRSLKGAQPSLIQWAPGTSHPGESLEPQVRIEEIVLGLPEPDRLRTALESLGADIPVNETPAPVVAAHLRVIDGPDFWL